MTKDITWNPARPFRNYDDKYRVVLTFDSKEDARKFVEAWNEVHK